MTFLPIVGRELRVAARRKRTYWSRGSAAAMAFFIIGWMLLTTARWMDPAMMARSIFTTLTMLLFVFALFCGAGATADCISSEKREGTLGLLFLTDLKGYDIVLGKLTASALGNFYSLLAALPVLAIPLLLGGVGVGELAQAAALLLNTMFFSVAVGMWASVRSHDDRKAMSATVGMILLITALLPLIAAIVKDFSHAPKYKWIGEVIIYAFYYPSPGYAMGMLQSSQFNSTGLGAFWGSLATTLAISLVLLAHAARRLPHVWQDQAKEQSLPYLLGNLIAFSIHFVWQLPRGRQGKSKPRSSPRLGEFVDRLTFGSPEQRKRLRAWLLDENPYLWLAARERLKPVLVWALLGALGVIWLVCAVKVSNEWFDPATYISTAWVLHSLLKAWIGSEACRSLNKDRQSGALELLLSTPLTVPEILQGQMRALWRQFAKPILVVLLLDVIFMVSYKPSFNDMTWHAVMLAGMVIFVLDAWTLAWVGMWQGIRSKNGNQAVRRTYVQVLIWPWVFWIGIATLGLFSSTIGGEGSLGLWLAISLFMDFILQIQARDKLNSQLRLLAMERYQPPKQSSWWPFGRAEGNAPPIIDS